MKIQDKLVEVFNNKHIIIIVFILFLGGINTGCNSEKSIVKKKLIGTWNLEMENSTWIRDSIYDFVGILMDIEKDSVSFPMVYEPSEVDFQGKTFLDEDFDIYDNEENVEKENKRIERMEGKSKGRWKIISINPDSILFDVPYSPFNGKYAIRFYIDEKGYEGYPNIYKMELTNDTTNIICNKGWFTYQKIRKVWED